MGDNEGKDTPVRMRDEACPILYTFLDSLGECVGGMQEGILGSSI